MSNERAFSLPRLGSSHPASPDGTTARGYADGFARGWTAGLDKGRAAAALEAGEIARLRQAEHDAAKEQLARAGPALDAAALAANSRTALDLDEAASWVAHGAVLIAEALVGRELSDRGLAARAALARAVPYGIEDEVVRVRMNPEDIAALPADLDVVPAHISLEPDASLSTGDAISILAVGYLDARIAQAITRVREELGVEQ